MSGVATAIGELPMGRAQTEVLLATMLVWSSMGVLAEACIYVKPLMMAELGLTEFEMSLMQTSLLLFTAFGCILAAFLGDSYGRRRCMLIGAIGMVVFVPLQAAATSQMTLMAIRFFAGSCLGLAAGCAPPYLAEMLPIHRRGLYLMLFNLGYASAACIFVSVASVMTSWRLYLGITVVPPLLLLCMLQLVPESPRYLALVGRHEEAVAVVQGMYTKNGVPPPRHLAGDHGDEFEAHRALQLMLDHPEHAYTFFIIGLPWIFLACASGGLRFALPYHVSQDGSMPFKVVLLWTAADVVGNLSASFLGDSMGRRNSSLLGFGLAALSSCLLISPPAAMEGPWTNALGAVQQGTQAWVWLNMGALSCELFPTECRAFAAAGLRGLELIVWATAPLLAGAMHDAGKLTIAIGIFAGCYVVGLVLAAVLLRGECEEIVGKNMVESHAHGSEEEKAGLTKED